MSSTVSSRRLWNNPEMISGLGRVLALAVLMVGMGVVSDAFASVQNLRNVVTNASVMIMLGVGQTITIITKGPDLSMGSVLTICAVVAAIMVKVMGIFFPFAMLGAVALGMALGFLNGFMIAKVGIPSFIATYGMQWAVFGFAYVILRGYVIYDFDPAFRLIGNGYLFGVIPAPVVVMIIVVGAGIFVMRKTTMGRRFFAVGANYEAARMSGIRTDKTIIWAFVLSGLLAALSGIVLVARINAVQADIGAPYLLLTVATVFMGGTRPTGGEGSIIGTVIGALIITVVNNGMNLLAVPTDLRGGIVGALIIATVLVDVQLRKRLVKTG